MKKGDQSGETNWPPNKILLWLLRAVMVITIIHETLSGDFLYAAEALLALALIILATRVFRARQGPSSLDIEIVLLIIAIGNCTLGVALNLYRTLPYYDKLLHVLNPTVLAFYCITFLRTFVDTPDTDDSSVVLVVVATLLVLGTSAIWELLEFLSDQFFMTTTQGSPTMGPLADTMWDLLLSLGGALLGAIGAEISDARFARSGQNQTGEEGMLL